MWREGVGTTGVCGGCGWACEPGRRTRQQHPKPTELATVTAELTDTMAEGSRTNTPVVVEDHTLVRISWTL